MVMSTKKIVRGIDKSLNKAVSEINASTPKPDMKDDGAELKAAVAPKKAMTFAEAFRAARKDPEAMKRGTFTYGGKSFSTKMAGEGGKKAAPKGGGATSTSKSPLADFYLNKYPKIKGNAANIKGAGPMFTGKYDDKTSSKPAAQQQQKARPKDTVRTGRDILGGILDTSKREKEIARGASKPRDYAADRARMKNEKIAEKAARRKELGIREPGKAKGGRIDGAAIRGKTRAMKKGK